MSYFQRVYRFRLPTTDWLQEWLVERFSFVAVQTSDGNFNVSKDLPRFSTKYLTVLNMLEWWKTHRIWWGVNQQVGGVRLWGTYSDWCKKNQIFFGAMSTWHWYLEDFLTTLKVEKFWKHQQRVLDFTVNLRQLRLASLASVLKQPFGLELWLSTVKSAIAGSGWKPGGQCSKLDYCHYCHVLSWPPRGRSSRWCLIYTTGCAWQAGALIASCMVGLVTLLIGGSGGTCAGEPSSTQKVGGVWSQMETAWSFLMCATVESVKNGNLERKISLGGPGMICLVKCSGCNILSIKSACGSLAIHITGKWLICNRVFRTTQISNYWNGNQIMLPLLQVAWAKSAQNVQRVWTQRVRTQSTKSAQNVQRIRSVQNVQCVRSAQNVQRVRSVQTVQRVRTQRVRTQSTKSAQNVQRIRSVQNVQRVRSAQNVQRVRSVQTVQRVRTQRVRTQSTKSAQNVQSVRTQST